MQFTVQKYITNNHHLRKSSKFRQPINYMILLELKSISRVLEKL